MAYFISPNPRIAGPLPRRDILAVCEFLNRKPQAQECRNGGCHGAAEILLDRLAAAARMQ